MTHAEGWSGKRYHAFGHYLRGRFGSRVWKVTVDAGLTCPNRDGTVGRGGCAYCLREAHSPGGAALLPVREQIAVGIERLRRLRKAELFIVYFQAGTNTYAPLGELETLFDKVRGFGNVVGLAVGTRPDCLGGGVLGLLESYSGDFEVWLELGLQSAHDGTLRSLKRGHDVEAFTKAYDQASSRRLKLCVHLILGLPGESREETLETVRFVAGLKPDGIKLHPLQVLRGTLLAERFLGGGVNIMPRHEYAGMVCDALELLPPETTIQRLTAEARGEVLMAPDWCSKKRDIIEAVDSEMLRRNSLQGRRFALQKRE